MGRYVLKRLSMAVPQLFVVSVMLFAIMNSIGDPLAIQMSTQRPPTGQELEVMRRRMGLDKPIYLQYIYWLIGNDWTLVDANGDGNTDEHVFGQRKGILRGDLGFSLTTHQPAQQRIAERLPNTLLLMIPTYGIILLLALSLGIFSALRKYTAWDNGLTAVAFIFYSMPVFFVSLAMIYVFSVGLHKLGWPSTPIAGMYEVGEAKTPGNLLRHMILPVASLAIISAAGYSRFVRSSVLEVMNRDYVRTARSKGLPERSVFGVHVLKNAALPLITIVGLDLPFLLGGAIVTERIYAWPGMGQLFIESLGTSDYPVLMGILMFIAVAVVGFQLITDLTYSVLDPRVRLVQ
jgi:peptide/nickel transport system permease protein